MDVRSCHQPEPNPTRSNICFGLLGDAWSGRTWGTEKRTREVVKEISILLGPSQIGDPPRWKNVVPCHSKMCTPAPFVERNPGVRGLERCGVTLATQNKTRQVRCRTGVARVLGVGGRGRKAVFMCVLPLARG